MGTGFEAKKLDIFESQIMWGTAHANRARGSLAVFEKWCFAKKHNIYWSMITLSFFDDNPIILLQLSAKSGFSIKLLKHNVSTLRAES